MLNLASGKFAHLICNHRWLFPTFAEPLAPLSAGFVVMQMLKSISNDSKMQFSKVWNGNAKANGEKKRQQSCECQATTIASCLCKHVQYFLLAMFYVCFFFLSFLTLLYYFFTIYRKIQCCCKVLWLECNKWSRIYLIILLYYLATETEQCDLESWIKKRH